MTKQTNEQIACNNWEKIGILKGRKEREKEILEMIEKTKLPEDKDYRYSNEYIEEWINELKLTIEGEGK